MMHKSLIILCFGLLIRYGHNCKSKTAHGQILKGHTISPSNGDIEVEDAGPVLKLKVLNTQEGHKNFGRYSIVELVPSKIKMDANMVDFELMTAPLPGDDTNVDSSSHSKYKVLERKILNNNSPAELEDHYEFKFKTYHSRTYSFMQNLKLLANVNFKVSVPFIGEGESSVGLETQFQATQEFKTHEEKEEIKKRIIKIPPFSSVEVSASYDTSHDVKTPFEATIHVTGSGKITENFDGEITTTDGSVSAELLETILRNRGFEPDVKDYRENILVIRITGSMTGTLSVGVIHLKELIGNTPSNNNTNTPKIEDSLDFSINEVMSTPPSLESPFFANYLMNYSIFGVIAVTILVLIAVAIWKVHMKYKSIPTEKYIDNSYEEKFL